MPDDVSAVIIHLAYTLLVTIILEEAVAAFFFGTQWMGYVLVFLVNAATNPLINVAYQLLNTFMPISPHSLVVIILELVVVWAEYRLISLGMNSVSRRWLILSITANTVSYIAGLLIFS